MDIGYLLHALLIYLQYYHDHIEMHHVMEFYHTE